MCVTYTSENYCPSVSHVSAPAAFIGWWRSRRGWGKEDGRGEGSAVSRVEGGGRRGEERRGMAAVGCFPAVKHNQEAGKYSNTAIKNYCIMIQFHHGDQETHLSHIYGDYEDVLCRFWGYFFNRTAGGTDRARFREARG